MERAISGALARWSADSAEPGALVRSPRDRGMQPGAPNYRRGWSCLQTLASVSRQLANNGQVRANQDVAKAIHINLALSLGCSLMARYRLIGWPIKHQRWLTVHGMDCNFDLLARQLRLATNERRLSSEHEAGRLTAD